MAAEIIDFATRRATATEPAQVSSAGALHALAAIIDRARPAGSIAPADQAAFAVHALAVMGASYELRTRA